MRAEDIPSSVVTACCDVAPIARGTAARTIAAALAEYERLGYRLVHDDEATVERMAEAMWEIDGGHAPLSCYRYLARAALTITQADDQHEEER